MQAANELGGNHGQMISISSLFPVIFQAVGFEIGAWNCLKVGKKIQLNGAHEYWSPYMREANTFICCLDQTLSEIRPLKFILRNVDNVAKISKRPCWLFFPVQTIGGTFWICENRQDVTQSRLKKLTRPSWNVTSSSSRDEILVLILSVNGKISCHPDLYHAGLKAKNPQHPHKRQGWRIQPPIHSGRRKIICG